MTGLQQAVEHAGGQAALAIAIGVKQQHVWNWLNRSGKPAPSEHCAAIEGATGGAVMRWALRPDDWHLIWPELKERKDAPKLPVLAAASEAA